MSDGSAAFGQFLKPQVYQYLCASGLDVSYTRARGDRIYYRNASGEEVEILDLVGGFGASLLGHNNPEIAAVARKIFSEERPFHAQASVRGAAGELAKRLCAQAERATGKGFVATFANSGAEAVEAALKHAEMERGDRVRAILAGISGHSHGLRRALREHRASLPPALLERGAKIFGEARLSGLDDLLHRLYRAASVSLDIPPVFIAIEGAFHGKTSGSVQLTHRAEYHAPWRLLGPRTVFVPPGDWEAIRSVVEANTIRYLDLEWSGGREVELVERVFVNVGAVFAEPIQGEGGVVELDAEYLRGVSELCSTNGVPFVLDEIQSGMGRTGRFFAAEHQGVSADYYLLSKTLGAGVAKISAILISRDRYLPDFGFAHTSTFAEDDFSSMVATAALDIIERDDGALMKRCEDTGTAFLKRLNELQAAHPEQVGAIRGRGLMVGVQLASQDESVSPLIRVLSEQELLGFVVSGYFLHEHGIRVAPTLSSRATLRIEPSYDIKMEDLERFCGALEELADVLGKGDAYRLLRYLVGRARDVQPPVQAEAKPPLTKASPDSAKVGFLSHFLEPEYLRVWEPSLGPFTPADCERFLERTRGIIEPFVAGTVELRSAVDTKVHATIIGLPFIPAQAVAAMREGEGEWANELIELGVELARQQGCSIVGFGGYTSILSNNCRSISASDVALTSGNSLTAAAGLDALFLAADRRGIEHRVLGVLGAVGNIGRVLADVAADEIDELVLIGRARGERRLIRAASDLCLRVYRRIAEGDVPRAGLDRALWESGIWELWKSLPSDDVEILKRSLWDALTSQQHPPLRIATSLEACTGCNLLITATNAPRPIIGPEHLAKEGPVVVCDVAVPLDVDPAVVRERPNATVLRGGLVKAPLGQVVKVDGMSLRPGEIYGCLGETLLMGLAGIGEDYSYGSLDALKVRRIRQIARMNGFSVEENPLI